MIIYHFIQYISDYCIIYLSTNLLINRSCLSKPIIHIICIVAESYGQCAHVTNIIFKFHLDIWVAGKETDFVLTHDRFESPQYVLRDDVSLYVITKTHAIFLQARSDWPNPFFTEDFYQTEQYDSASKVIYMPLQCFHKLAESMEDDGTKMIFLQNTSRCGSSLLNNIFKATGRCVCFNEPHCYSSVCYLVNTRQLWRGDAAKKVYRSVIRVLCKPYGGLSEKVIAYVIKPSATCSGSMELMQELFPDSYHFFIYRDPSVVAVSLRRVGQALISFRLLYELPNFPRVLAFWLRLSGYPDGWARDYTCAVHPDLEFGYRAALSSISYYLKTVDNGVNIRGIRYSHLVKNKDRMVSQIFQACGLSQELVNKATDAMKIDSHKFSPVSREILAQIMPYIPQLTPQYSRAGDQMADEFGVPRADVWQDTSFVLKNSLIS